MRSEALLTIPASELLDALARSYHEAIEAFLTALTDVPPKGPDELGPTAPSEHDSEHTAVSLLDT